MTKQEVQNIIESKGKEYGFKMRKTTVGWMSEQTGESFARVEIFAKDNNEKSSWEDHRIWLDIEAEGSICRMGGTTTVEELKKAAEEIGRAARMVEEIRSMNLSYIETF